MSNLLLDLHRQAQAEFQPYGKIEIVSTFTEPQAEYAAIWKSGGLMDLPQRGFIELIGKDRLSFLNALITAQTQDKQTGESLVAGRWVYSFFLNLKGRIVADMNVLELGERTLIEVDHRMVEALLGLFEAYHFAEAVKLRGREDLHEIALHGPGSLEILDSLTQLPDRLGEMQNCAEVRIFAQDAIVWRDDPTGKPGFHIILPDSHARALWMHLITVFAQPDELGRRRLRPIGWAAFNTARIEAGRPIFGVDFDGAPVASAYPSKQQRDQTPESSPGILPAETGQLQRAVSLTKCYVGQEIVARMHARGQIAKMLVGIRMENDALPIAGNQILDDASNVVGVITSSTISPVLSNAAICLGYVKRPLYALGTKLRIAAEGALHSGTVVQTPFVEMKS